MPPKHPEQPAPEHRPGRLLVSCHMWELTRQTRRSARERARPAGSAPCHWRHPPPTAPAVSWVGRRPCLRPHMWSEATCGGQGLPWQAAGQHDWSYIQQMVWAAQCQASGEDKGVRFVTWAAYSKGNVTAVLGPGHIVYPPAFRIAPYVQLFMCGRWQHGCVGQVQEAQPCASKPGSASRLPVAVAAGSSNLHAR